MRSAWTGCLGAGIADTTAAAVEETVPVDTFHWHVRPENLPVKGHVYPDGSLLDGIAPELARSGWACVVMNDDSEVIAAAYGVPPPWVKGIEGAEAWALHQGVGLTIPAECN